MGLVLWRPARPLGEPQVLRVILVENRQPLDEQNVDRLPRWRSSPTLIAAWRSAECRNGTDGR